MSATLWENVGTPWNNMGNAVENDPKTKTVENLEIDSGDFT